MQRQKYQRHWKLGLKTLYVWLHPHPSPVSGTRYTFILEVVPIYTIHVENKKIKICLFTLKLFWSFVSSFSYKNLFLLVNTCTINLRYTNIKTMCFAHAWSSGLSVTYISWLTPLVTPFYEMQFKPSYLLRLNELVGLAYVQNLGLLMKRAPGC